MKQTKLTDLLVLLICAIAFITLVGGSWLFSEVEVRDARIAIVGR